MSQEPTSPNNELNIKDIPRCPKCSLIPSITIFYSKEKPFITYECQNKHQDTLSLENYINLPIKSSLINTNCEECKKNQNEGNSCKNNHQPVEEDNIINNKRFDSICKTHSNTFCFYCVVCKKNICIYCKNEHETHPLIDLSKFIVSNEDIQKFEEEINNFELTIANLVKIKEEIISLINDLKKSCILEMKFIKILLNNIQNQAKMNNINYNIIQNFQSFKKCFKLNKIDRYENINKEGNKFISLIKKEKSMKFDSFQNNFKIIKNHTSSILYLLMLNDGRLASSSSDFSLNIYKKDSFGLEISIKEHQCGIPSFTQMNDGRIITCSDDNSMKLIKIEKNKYNVEQVIKEHQKSVRKIIEIKGNIYASVSCDKTMKIWKLNNEKKLELKKNITFQNSASSCNILKLNDKEYVTSSVEDKCLKFWNSDNYLNIAIINNIEPYWTLKTLCKLDDDILCVGGDNSKGFYLINISNHQLIKNIKVEKSITSMDKCLNGLLLCSIIDEKGNNILAKYYYDDYNLVKNIEKEKAHNAYIYSVVELNDEIIASGGEGKQIKLWKY